MSGTSITYSAPGRCGIVGNPSDMYGGSVISCSISERAYVTIEDSDLLEIEVAKLGLEHKFGIVRIISYNGDKPAPGIVGFQRHGHVVYGYSVAFSETVLASVPSDLAATDLPKLLKENCQKLFP